MYLIVEFNGGHEVAIVPQNWFKDDSTVFWPPYKTSMRINNAAMKCEPPSDSWSLEKISRVMYRNEKYERVRIKLKQSEETSDLQTSDDEKKRKRKPTKKLCDTSETESNSDAAGDDDSDDHEECRPAKKLAPAEYIPPPRLPIQTLRDRSNSTAVPRSISPRLSETPSRVQKLGPAAVTQILTILESLREDNRELKRMLHRLLARSTANDQLEQLPEGLQFPIKNCEEMDVFNDLLKDQEKMTSVVRYLSMFGGADVREVVDRILKYVITNQIAKLYNMKGMKGKRRFEGLQLLIVLYKCVQRNDPSKTRKDVEEEVAKWLAGARDRDGGRKERLNRPQTQPQAQENEENE